MSTATSLPLQVSEKAEPHRDLRSFKQVFSLILRTGKVPVFKPELFYLEFFMAIFIADFFREKSGDSGFVKLEFHFSA